MLVHELSLESRGGRPLQADCGRSLHVRRKTGSGVNADIQEGGYVASNMTSKCLTQIEKPSLMELEW